MVVQLVNNNALDSALYSKTLNVPEIYSEIINYSSRQDTVYVGDRLNSFELQIQSLKFKINFLKHYSRREALLDQLNQIQLDVKRDILTQFRDLNILKSNVKMLFKDRKMNNCFSIYLLLKLKEEFKKRLSCLLNTPIPDVKLINNNNNVEIYLKIDPNGYSHLKKRLQLNIHPLWDISRLCVDNANSNIYITCPLEHCIYILDMEGIKIKKITDKNHLKRPDWICCSSTAIYTICDNNTATETISSIAMICKDTFSVVKSLSIYSHLSGIDFGFENQILVGIHSEDNVIFKINSILTSCNLIKLKLKSKINIIDLKIQRNLIYILHQFSSPNICSFNIKGNIIRRICLEKCIKRELVAFCIDNCENFIVTFLTGEKLSIFDQFGNFTTEISCLRTSRGVAYDTFCLRIIAITVGLAGDFCDCLNIVS